MCLWLSDLPDKFCSLRNLACNYAALAPNSLPVAGAEVEWGARDGSADGADGPNVLHSRPGSG